MTNNKKQRNKNVIGHLLSVISERNGQSLVEVLIGLTIGAILIGAASLGVVFILRSSTSTQHLQSATQFNQDLADRVRSVAGATWQDLHSLTKGTSTAYFVAASGTKQIVIEGKEGVLSNEIFNGLVGHWKFDEATSTATTTTFDVSGKGNHGILTNGPTRATTTCKVSHCLDFDGTNDYVEIGDISDLDFGTSSFSVSAWFYDDPASGQTDWRNIVSKKIGGGNNAGWTLRLDQTDQVNFFVADGTSNNHCQGGIFSEGEWHFAVGVVDKTTDNKYLYVDNVLVKTCSNVGSVSASTSLRIGSWGATTDFWWGKIDDVRIYNRALSADEVQRLWNSTAFTRYFSIENVSRDSNGDIVTSGGNDDPSTQKITTYVQWPTASGATGEVSIVDYVTRWANRVFNQSDWSGGSGQSSVLTEPNNRFDNATSVSSPAGSIRIEGL